MKTNKFILVGTANDGFIHKYVLKKNEDFKESFLEFMMVLGFEYEDIRDVFVRSFYEDDERIEVELNVIDIEDEIYYFENDDYEAEIFFGNKKVIFVIRTKKRIPMKDFLEKQDWVSNEEAEKIRSENLKDLKKKARNQRSKKVMKKIEIKK